MEWTLSPETDLTAYGKTHLLDIQEILGKSESASLNPADGSLHLVVPDAHVKEALIELYESSPALQGHMEKEVFLEKSTVAIRDDLIKGTQLVKETVRAAEIAQKKDDAYQAFCQIEGVTAEEKEKAKVITEEGIRKNDWISAASLLRSGMTLPHYGKLLESIEGKCKPIDVLRIAKEDLAEAQQKYKLMGEATDALFLTNPKMDLPAALAASIHIGEPDMDAEDLKAALRDPAEQKIYHKEGEALANCVTVLSTLHDEVEVKILEHEVGERDTLTTEDVKELLMKTRDIIGTYEYGLPEKYEFTPACPIQMGTDEDRFNLLTATETIEVLRDRLMPDSQEKLAGKTMRDVFSSCQGNFDYRELTTRAVEQLMEKGASKKTLKEAVAIGREVCPSIGKTKDLLKQAEKRQHAAER